MDAYTESRHHDWYDNQPTDEGVTQLCSDCGCVAFVDDHGNMRDISDTNCPEGTCCWKPAAGE